MTTQQKSFSKAENEVMPEFRRRINEAESTEDVKKFFTYTIRELFDKIFPDGAQVNLDEIRLQPEESPGYWISESVLGREDVTGVWSMSDLPNILERLAQVAGKRHAHLMKNPQRSESKIRM
ncbi:MAG: hypothetical protein RBS34_15985 [Desulfofustis sp.]|jgi:hypothetical protein|nr:hypothetical protein [Desulfofustis sp.]